MPAARERNSGVWHASEAEQRGGCQRASAATGPQDARAAQLAADNPRDVASSGRQRTCALPAEPYHGVNVIRVVKLAYAGAKSNFDTSAGERVRVHMCVCD